MTKTKKVVVGVMLLMIGLISIIACSKKDNVLDSRDALKTKAVSQLKVGISVENDPVNGTYLRFSSDSVLIRFADSLSELSDEETALRINSLVKKGFTPRATYEDKTKADSSTLYPRGYWSYILNEHKYFKIGDTLYEDDNQVRLYVIDKEGKKTLIKDRTKDNSPLKASSTCNSIQRTVSGSFGAYPAGASGMNTLELNSSIEHYVPFLGDQKIILNSSLAMRPVDGYLSSATGTFSNYFSYDLYANGQVVGSNALRTSPSGVSSFKYVIAQSQFICLGYVYVTFKATRADGRYVQGQLRMEP